jgi:hypothetical protein
MAGGIESQPYGRHATGGGFCATLLGAILLGGNEETERLALRVGQGEPGTSGADAIAVYVGVAVGGMFWLSAKMLSGSYLSFNATSRPNFSSP